MNYLYLILIFSNELSTLLSLKKSKNLSWILGISIYWHYYLIPQKERHIWEKLKISLNEHQKKCPLSVLNQYQKIIKENSQGITQLLYQEVEEHQSALRGKKIDEINQDFSGYEQIDPLLILSYQKIVLMLNAKFNEINSIIDKKIDNPNIIVESNNIKFSLELSEAESNIEKINQAIIKHNSEISGIFKS